MIAMLSVPSNEERIRFTESGIDEIRYNHTDSSVPPQYHRSYTISITPESIAIIVDSYGDIIAEKKFGCTPGQFNHLLSLLDEGKVKNVNLKKEDGCTGGTGEELTCRSAGTTIFNGKAYYCGGKTSGTLGGSIDNFKTAVKLLIPDFEKVLDRK